MIKEVRTVEELTEFFFHREGELLLKEKVVMTLNDNMRIAKRIICEPTVVEIGKKMGDGFIIKASGSSWLTFEISNHNLLIADDYIAIITDYEGTVTITKYSLKSSDPPMGERHNVRMVLHCSVSDINYTMAVKKLTKEEVLYCLEYETRKTGIKNLKSQARRLNMEV